MFVIVSVALMEVKAKVRQAGDAMKKTLADDYNALDFAGAYKELNFAGAYEKRDPRELNIVGAYKKLNISVSVKELTWLDRVRYQLYHDQYYWNFKFTC